MSRVGEFAALFLRLGCTAFGGPAAHIVLIERECVQRRQWRSRGEFVDLLGVANLIPGPTSTELAMHVGRRRAGWPGLVVAVLAATYVRAGDLPISRGILAAVAPVVVVLVLQAIAPLARTALRSPMLVALGVAASVAAVVGLPEIQVLLGAGLLHVLIRRGTATRVVLFMAMLAAPVLAATASDPGVGEVFRYFVRIGSLLFGSGYVLLPVLEGDLVGRFGWLTEQQLLDAIAAVQATPGPVFTTATFIGYVIGGPWMTVAATVGMFRPAFVFSALSSVMLDRLKTSALARAFLDGVNVAAVALIAVVIVTLGRAAFTGWWTVGIAVVAAVLLFGTRVHPTLVLLAAALLGALMSQF